MNPSFSFLMTQDISLWIKKILVLFLITGLLYVLYTISDTLIIVLIAGFITILVNPLVNLGERHHVPSWLTLMWVYIGFFVLGSVIIGTFIPIITDYISIIIRTIIDWANNIQQVYTTQGGLQWFNLHPYIERGILFLFWEANINHTLDIIKQNAGSIQSFLTNQITSLTTGWISFVSSVGWVVTEWALIWVTTFLMVLERKTIGKFLLNIVPNKMSTYLENHYFQIQNVGNSWIRAILILCLSIFSMTYIGLLLVQWIFGVDIPQAFTLALISGIMEFIPYAGPIISLLLAVIIGLGISWEVALILAVLFIIVQQIEGNFLVPYVMSKSLDLSPFFVFLVMLIGATLGGILGIILAVPIAGVCKVVYSVHMKSRETPVALEAAMNAEEPTTKWTKNKKKLT
jgi:predicted PurR-regulated permease PerM